MKWQKNIVNAVVLKKNIDFVCARVVEKPLVGVLNKLVLLKPQHGVF